MSSTTTLPPPLATNPTPTTSTRYTAPLTTAHTSGLPIIDISPFLSATSAPSARHKTAQAINAACVNYGFFYLSGHGIPVEKLDEILALARRFFALPLAQKNRIKRFDAGGAEGGDSARGYQGLGENVTGGLQDLQEAVDWYREWDFPGEDGGDGTVKTLQGANLWPEEPVELKSVYEAYIAQVQGVGKALVHAMGVALGLGPPASDDDDAEDENVFVRNCAASFWVMRMIGYPPLSTPLSPGSDPSQFSCGAHTDYGCVTLLLTDPTPGALQVQLRDGTWLNADPIRGAFVVNIGDMIERWTNGLWKSTLHRVVHRGDRYRVSVPFFYEPGFDSVVRPLRECVRRSGRAEMGEGGTYGEHLLTKVFSNFYYSKRTDW
ncbi:Clavaminate synthase-like protein [Dothidotthia symphoricarpi CBS 119687]|uniref:Clavaminate synthase-like protein n=1 Tax=Dothidotthia symphoricarpi CBS 119687 TaxID=1392245 RepID=A0A6A6AGG3_9PLEO|nr:Clavaminate synthase-like protein [Dothidotthia symphoricarpi CBS 119687]KAF2130215.1 Clavaminate synthase-like protein [Dothidotthia symphoricarpi CBS 119687]